MRVYGASNWSCTLGHRAQVPGVPASGEARAHAHCLATYASMWLLANVKLDLPASWIRGWEARQRPEGLPALHQWPKGTAGLGNPRVRVSTAGEIGDPGPLLGQAECLEPASRGIHMGCMYFPLTGCHPDQLERGTGWGHGTVCVCKVLCFLSVLIHMAGHRYVYVWYVCEPTGNTCSASLLAGPEATELQQPPLCRAAGHNKP